MRIADSVHPLQDPFAGRLIVVGAGCGGPQALAQILPLFPADFPGTIVVVQHMRPGFTRVVIDLVSYSSKLPVYEPLDGQLLQASRVLVAPVETALTFERTGALDDQLFRINLDDIHDDADRQRNRINETMASASHIFRRDTIGVLLTGIGDDGREGMRAIVEAGGLTIAQDEESSAVHGMPAAAVDAGVVHEELALWSIATHINSLVIGDASAAIA